MRRKPERRGAHALVVLALAFSGSGASTFAESTAESGAAPRPLDLDVAVSASSLDGTYASWFEGRLGFSKDFGERRILFGSATTARRFGVDAQQYALGGSRPFGDRVTAGFEATAGPGSRFFADWSISGELGLRLDGGFALGASHRHREYGGNGVSITNATLEKYAGAYRVAYTLWLSRVELSPSGRRASHSATLTRYYRERSSVALILGTGNGLETLDRQRVVETRTRTAVLSGAHWFGERVALTWSAGFHRQDPFYDRLEAQVGFRRRF
jgi:YaiO family outer membrane protein